MRRWFLSHFYRLGLGAGFGPPTQYVDKAPVDTEPWGDEIVHVVDVGDSLLASSPSGDTPLKSEIDP